MANYKLSNDNFWETSGVYDVTQEKTQREINADVINHTASASKIKTVSNDIVTFDDGVAGMPVKHIDINFGVSQDLHGYEYPWKAGESNNLIPDGTDTNNGYVYGKYPNNTGGYTTNADWYTSEYFSVTEGETYTWSGNSNPTAPSIFFYNANKEYLSYIQANKELPKTFTAPSGAVYCRASQGKNFAVNGQQIELGSTATTPKPYSNICPFTGFDSADVVVSNRTPSAKKVLQLYPQQAGEGYPSPDNPRPLSTNVLVRDDGTTATVWRGNFEPFNRKFTRTHVVNNLNDFNWAKYTVSSKTIMRTNNGYGGDGSANGYCSHYRVTGASPGNLGNYQMALATGYWDSNNRMAVRDERYKDSSHTQFKTDMGNARVVRPAKTPTIFNDLSVNEINSLFNVPDLNGGLYGKLYSTSFGGNLTVYGGVVDFTNGVLTVTHGHIAEYDGEELPGVWASSMDVYEDGTTPSIGAEVVYELETPVTYTIEANSDVTLVHGTNYIMSNGNMVTVEYGEYLSTIGNQLGEKVPKVAIAPIEKTTIASKAYAVNELFFMGDTLYIATAAIASGAKFTVGTNCDETTLGEQITALLNA